jgi:hypothetical protein
MRRNRRTEGTADGVAAGRDFCAGSGISTL